MKELWTALHSGEMPGQSIPAGRGFSRAGQAEKEKEVQAPKDAVPVVPEGWNPAAKTSICKPDGASGQGSSGETSFLGLL